MKLQTNFVVGTLKIYCIVFVCFLSLKRHGMWLKCPVRKTAINKQDHQSIQGTE